MMKIVTSQQLLTALNIITQTITRINICTSNFNFVSYYYQIRLIRAIFFKLTFTFNCFTLYIIGTKISVQCI
jgi:hypothetical protein